MRRNETGVILITVLLIFAATTLLVVSLQTRFIHTAKLSSVLVYDSQLEAYLRGAEHLAGVQLQQNLYDDLQEGERLDHGSEPWAQMNVYPIDGGEVRTQLVDLQGRLNLNGIAADAQVQQVFLRLLDQLEIPSDVSITSADVLNIVLDWMDPDERQQGFVASEDDYYSGLEHGYLTAGTPLVHLSELLLLRGISKADYVVLSQYVTILPNSATLNINTVSLALAQALNPLAGGDLVHLRPADGYTPNDMATLSDHVKPLIPFGVESQYFELRSQVFLGDRRRALRSWLYLPVATRTQQLAPSEILARDTGWALYYQQ